MKSRYDVLLYEARWNNFLHFREQTQVLKKRTNFFSAVLPPPNITGTLHLGHAFQCTLLDFLMRHNKIIGKDVFWQGGVDHAGIATQVLVERNLLSLGYSKCNYTRYSFVKFTWYWKLFSHDVIISQMKCLSVHINWLTFRFTLDGNFSNSVKHAFVKLHEKGVVYEGKKLVNWDILLKTAVSDLEVTFVEEIKKLWFVFYKVVFTRCRLLVATTRPETILVDSAVAINPDDIRYNRIVGTYVRTPITNTLIPLIVDTSVSLFFGSGCVKVTPAHDFNDYLIACAHHLRVKLLYDEKTFIVNLQNFTEYNGISFFNLLNTFSYVSPLRKCTFFIKKHIALTAVGERTGARIEPVLLKQWFVSVQELCRDSISSVRKNEILFYPALYKKTYLHWLSNLEDWCISRQIWWGHRVPVWRNTSTDAVYVGYDEDTVRKKFNLTSVVKLRRDRDVLDTWFSSALWPFAALGWPKLKQSYLKFYPLSVLVTGYDILFFWVARMIMFGLVLIGTVPFKSIFIHGLVKDSYGVKMSKSKGNTLDPIDIINGVSLKDLLFKQTFGVQDIFFKKRITGVVSKKYPDGIYPYGVDALRATLCSAAVPGRSVYFSVKNVEIFRNFCTKLWNVGRFLFTQLKAGFLYYKDVGKMLSKITFIETCVFNSWFINKWLVTKQHVAESVEIFRFDDVVKYLSDFLLNVLSSVFLEVCKYKQILCRGVHRETNMIFAIIFFDFLVTAHPVLPNITTELWCSLYRFFTKRKFMHIVESCLVYKYSVKKCVTNNVRISNVRFLFNFVKAVRTLAAQHVTKEQILSLNIHLRCESSYFLLKYQSVVESFSGVFLKFSRTIKSSVLLFFLFGVGCYIEKESTTVNSDKVVQRGYNKVFCSNLTHSIENLTDLYFISNATQQGLACEKIKFAGLVFI